MISRKWFSLFVTTILFFGTFQIALGQPTNYIEKYKKIAIREMHRSGIPASITLAQGILESSWGNGSLALKANNHFGIKCKSYWTGPSFYIEDDDFKNGKLIKSCFRAYNNAEESYIDHTDFLTSNPRYQRLFSYDQTDYKRWAKGLKKCGYATDKKYANKLIANIEKYELWRFDLELEELPAVVASESAPPLQDVIVQNYSQQQPSNPMPVPTLPAPQPQREVVIPKAFVLPDNYQRGDGLRKLNAKGTSLQNTPSILWNR